MAVAFEKPVGRVFKEPDDKLLVLKIDDVLARVAIDDELVVSVAF